MHVARRGAVLIVLLAAGTVVAASDNAAPESGCHASTSTSQCAEPGHVEEVQDESAMVQVKTARHDSTVTKAKASGTFDYKTFQLGNWADVADACGGEPIKDAVNNQFQAPINIAVDGVTYDNLPQKSWPKFYAKDGGCEEAYFVPKGSAWQVDFMNPKTGLSCTNLEMEWNGKVYGLVQFHFHTLSEDTLDFKPFPLQMHMVHIASDGSVAVVGVLIETPRKAWHNKFNTFLTRVFRAGFSTNRTVSWNDRFNPYDGVLKKADKFWHYQGSFTTPPCTSGVDFLIAQTPVGVCASHVTEYEKYLKSTGVGNSYGQNYRPVQALNGRTISTGSILDIESGPDAPSCGVLNPAWVQRCEEEA